MSFVHLHVYSAFSLLTSSATIESLVKEAKNRGYSSIALTDRNVMYGTIAFYKECIKQSIKPIIGLTVDVLSEKGEGEAYPLVLLARNQMGLQNLLKITSVVQTKSQEGIPVKWLKHYTAGLIAITPGMSGEIEQNLLNNNEDGAKNSLELYLHLFGKDGFYLAIQDHKTNAENEIKAKMLQLANEYNLKIVASNEVSYIDKEDAFAQECLLAIKNGHKMQDEDRERLQTEEYYLKSPQEMVEIFSDIPEALENSLYIAEQCNVMVELNTQKLPKYPTERGITADELLESICLDGYRERYPVQTEEQKERLKYELKIIKEMKFSDYFLIVWDFMKFSRENGILTGPGRGSAAGSMVAYVLYITDVDPIEHDLLFERFLNPERISMPDIDIDFPDHRRDEVIEYVSKKYGELHVAQIITFGTLAAKAVVRDVGRAFGLNSKELDTLSRHIPSRLGITLKNAYQESEGLRRFVNESPLNQKLFDTALKLEGLPRHTSTHAAGVVISEEPLVNTIPIQSGHENVYLTQYAMEHLEDVGLLKMDFLGLRNLTLIETILDSIQRKTGRRLDIKAIPLEDEATFRLLSKGETTGIFQLESDGMRNVLKRLMPSRFEDIVAVNALYRPGPMENIPVYIDRKHGRETVTYPHPDLEPLLENTYGVIVYQEQIMQIASKLAGFSLGEADLLRRAVGKKQKEVLDKERNHFLNGAITNGYTEDVANVIYDLIVKFANYGFNRSHAVAYSFIAYQLAYLKAHYPLYFMAALLSSVVGNDTKIAQYIRELKEMDISILSPSINQSGYSFLVENGSIRYSLAAIKGVGIAALKEIFSARKTKKFVDLFDLCLRVPPRAVNRKTLESLIHSGSLDEFGEDRAVLLASLDVALDHAQLVNPFDTSEGDLFAEDEFFIKPKYVEVDPIRSEDKLQFEKEALGLYLSDHPVSIFKKYFGDLGAKQLSQIQDSKGNVTSVVYILESKKIRTKKGEAMAFLTISDQTGDMEAVAFPTVFNRISVLLQKGSIIMLSGKIDIRDGKGQFIVQNARDMKEVTEDLKHNRGTLYIKIETNEGKNDQLKKLKTLLQKYHGNVSVVLYYEQEDRSVKLRKEDWINPTEDCIEELKRLLGEKNVILKQ
ncbi:DNA polymerase III subunit alpha [Bacillus sp. 31A1R]|uniref:DNA polymerase III subunit alpha n=1 Tax=Robertmurraya mangrovi TaxID=3098077 RepID=A0ABU5IZG4_9BACI|nr:DNA polymerase III subunit alpha [Bacillus sp. 31A1R]MDZ5472495.1 DNA polymerase III subunit alpha [Bacillus sp. 31A1R]